MILQIESYEDGDKRIIKTTGVCWGWKLSIRVQNPLHDARLKNPHTFEQVAIPFDEPHKSLGSEEEWRWVSASSCHSLPHPFHQLNCRFQTCFVGTLITLGRHMVAVDLAACAAGHAEHHIPIPPLQGWDFAMVAPCIARHCLRVQYCHFTSARRW